MDKKRIIIAAILVVVMIAMGIYIYINRDTVFMHKIEVRYPDGCIERYEDGIMTSTICQEGRLLQAQKERSKVVWSPSNLNLS